MNTTFQTVRTVDASQWAAWWGAILATIVFTWDIFKWIQTRPSFRIRAYPNMQVAVGGKLENARYICVSVTNVGGSRTTIMLIGLDYYRSKFFERCRRPTERMIAKHIYNAEPLPYAIDAGSTWDGLIEQTGDIDEMLRDGVLYCTIHEARRDKPWRTRINPKKQ